MVTSEKPKAISSKRKARAAFHIFRYHVPSLLVTAFLTVLYSQTWLWPGSSSAVQHERPATFLKNAIAASLQDKPTTNQLAALQFAAKLYEGLILLSLSNLLFHRLRYLLLRSGGIPLGLLSSPFQLGNPLYVFSSEFIGAVVSAKESFTMLTSAVLVVIAILISLAAGPLSAVLMIPRLGHWQLPMSHPLIRPPVEVGLAPKVEGDHFSVKSNLSLADLYPSSIGPELGVTWSCPRVHDGSCLTHFQVEFASAFSSTQQINRFFNEPGEEVEVGNEEDLVPGMFAVMTRIEGALSFAVATAHQPPHQKGSTFQATVPLLQTVYTLFNIEDTVSEKADYAVKNFMGNLSLAVDGNRIPTKQPVVSMQCCGIRVKLENSTVSKASLLSLDTSGCYKDALYPAFNFTIRENLASQLASFNWTSGFLSFADIQDMIPYPISTAALVATPLEPGQPPESARLTICLFAARWGVTDDAYVGGNNFRAGANRIIKPGQPREFANPYERPASYDDLVHIDGQWINALDTRPINPWSIPGNDTRFTNDATVFQLLAEAGMGWCSLPALLAFIMAAAPCSGGGCAGIWDDQNVYSYAPRPAPGPEGEKEVWQQVRFYHEGYGYRWDQPIFTAAFVVLYMHAFIVVVHILLITAGGFWTSNAWSTIGQYVVLGICSTPSALLQNAGGGISQRKTWQLNASIREFEDGNRVELVVTRRSGVAIDSSEDEKATAARKGNSFPVPEREYG